MFAIFSGMAVTWISITNLNTVKPWQSEHQQMQLTHIII